MSSSLQLDPRLHARPPTARRERAPGWLLRILVFGIGVSLPLISFSSGGGITTSLASRVEAVDVLCLLTLVALVFSGRIRCTWGWGIYVVSLLLSLGLGSGNGPLNTVFTAFAALLMAALYFVVARSIATQETLVKAFLAGLVASTLGEAVIVVHDFLLPKWFTTSHEDRVRGTFRSTAQLGGFGFTAAGLLLSFGWVYFRSWWARGSVFLAGVMGVFFVLASTRRAGMFALLAWLGMYLLLGLKQMSRRSYWVVVGASLGAAVVAIAGASLFSHTHFFERFNLAYQQVASGNSFTHEQFHNAMQNIDMWFPLGIGVGLSPLVCIKHEAHNAHLGIIVEQGLLGVIGYYALWLPLLRRRWTEADFGRQTPVIRLILLTFLAGAIVFMIHARLDRDRVFMLFLGLAPWVACSAMERTRAAAPIPQRRPGGTPPGIWPPIPKRA